MNAKALPIPPSLAIGLLAALAGSSFAGPCDDPACEACADARLDGASTADGMAAQTDQAVNRAAELDQMARNKLQAELSVDTAVIDFLKRFGLSDRHHLLDLEYAAQDPNHIDMVRRRIERAETLINLLTIKAQQAQAALA